MTELLENQLNKKNRQKKNQIKAYINGKKIYVPEGSTILDACISCNIFIPRLCHDVRLKPQGACRLCLVQVEGRDEAVASCVTRLEPEMKINTSTPHIDELVKVNLELIISDHPLDCMTCESCGNCTLQDLAYRYDIKDVPYLGKVHDKKVFEDNPFIYRDNEKCILCGRCVRMCDDIVGANAIGYAGRGFESEIICAFEQSLKDTECVFCGNCISTCPVGALAPKPYMKSARIWETTQTETTCPYCGVGCVLKLHIKDNRIVDVCSEIGKNANLGNLCVKGKFGLDFVASQERLSQPLIKNQQGAFKQATWDQAIQKVAGRLKEIKQKHGPDAIAFLSSAKCTNEENFLLTKLARAVIGTNNVDHCARLCHASTVSGLIPTFGSGAMTNSIDDIKDADAAIIIGSNTTEAHPVIGYELIRCVKEEGLKLIVIDPRNIPITKYADIHLRQRPGTDIAVLLGMMHIIYKNNLHDQAFIEDRTEGFDQFVDSFKHYSPQKASDISGVDSQDLVNAAKLFGGAGNGLIFYSMGITQHTCGTDNVMAIADLAMMTGNVGRRGAGVNPLRGQNNVQGACDMGALPPLFAGYQAVSSDQIREKFAKEWKKPLSSSPGLTVTEIIKGAGEGKIKAIYIMGENPMLSDPDILHVAEALKKVDFLVVQDIFLTETAEFADVVLPGRCFAEKEGTYTNTERRVQRVRKAVDPPGEALDDWKIICSVSSALGHPMDYAHPSEIMDEIARLTPIYGGINYRRMEKESLQWPCKGPEDPGTAVLHAKSFTKGKGTFVPISHRPPAEEPDEDYPFIFTTGRVLYQFHTRTMTGKVEGLNEIAPMNLIHVNTEDAARLGLDDGDPIIVASRRGSIEANALVDERIKKGVAFSPFHYVKSPANKLTNPALDPKAKIPEYKACAVRITKAE